MGTLFDIRLWRGVFVALLSALLASLFVGCSHSNAPSLKGEHASSLLDGAKPKASSGVRCAECLTDSVIARNGDHWKTDVAALFRSTKAFVVYDLGQKRNISAAWLQGDNNDVYRLEVSLDGTNFQRLWDAKPVDHAGLRPRYATGLSGEARYVRVRAAHGDGSFSVTEVQLFEQDPESMPVGTTSSSGIDLGAMVRSKILLFGTALLLLLGLSYRKAPWWWLALLSLWPLWAAYDVGRALFETWPQEQREVSLVRGTVAVVTLVALLREFVFTKRFPASRPVVLGVLGLCGVVGALAFWNLGHPQFQDRNLNKPTYVHHLDLRQYYGTAKYFHEIGYRHLYEADLAAYLEDTRHSLASIANKPIRSLHTHRMSTAGDERQGIEEAPSLFSKERWQEYKRDARYFRDAMGTGRYFNTFYDLGGNATPVWISIAHLMFNQFEANDATFQLTALLDPILLIGAFLAIGLTFGPRTAFLCMVVFGCNDFIMYGSNWGGATLRHDWMAYIAFGACALRRKKWVLAGGLLALSTSIRAFPALSLLTLACPVIWWGYEYFRRNRKLPTWQVLYDEQRSFVLVALGAATTGLVLFLFASLLLGFDTWSDWLVKVGQLSAHPHGNHISLRSLIAGWEGDQSVILEERMPLFLLGIAFFIGMIFASCRGQRFEQAAVLGMLLTPVLFYPANYYIHLVWLLPLIMIEKKPARDSSEAPFGETHVWVGSLLLLLCAAQYFTVLEEDRGTHFYMASVLLFATMTAMLTVLVRANALTPALALPTSEPEKPPEPDQTEGDSEPASDQEDEPSKEKDQSGESAAE